MGSSTRLRVELTCLHVLWQATATSNIGQRQRQWSQRCWAACSFQGRTLCLLCVCTAFHGFIWCKACIKHQAKSTQATLHPGCTSPATASACPNGEGQRRFWEPLPPAVHYLAAPGSGAISRALPGNICQMQYTTYLYQAMHWLGVDACHYCCYLRLAPMWCSQCCSIGSRPSHWWQTVLCTLHSCWLQQGWWRCFRSRR